MPHDLYDLEFRLNGYRPATAEVGHDFDDRISLCELTTLAEHHTADGRHTFLVLHDNSTIYGVPGESALVALHLTRDVASRTFTFDSERLPLLALAQSWLIQRGCPTDAIDPPDTFAVLPADETTTALEQRLRCAANRYAPVESYVGEGYPTLETVVLLEAAHPPRSHPFRVLLETTDLQAGTRRLREGAFETAQAARDWLEDRSTPLPAPPPTPARGLPAEHAGPASARGRTR
ncbi:MULTISPECIES: hypothetical protein [unclassified Streptomyces]|uniref:hypothetical protein n=1 Tax=unclassified Streptomyces TaxID=2593676 RepID=UPI002967354F|nr:hypothetical protein [Streptomyces sp. SJL17-1]